ncbi:hypothetical protein [Streptomyces sp. NPDC050704]|uniref:hypothetical protein n=1 Tax=Streptomyces sp. NPDC050704 TaxID=3157219 RepID=UPI00341327F7
MLWPDPTQRERLTEIRNNLHGRIAEAEREGWLGEIDGLKVSFADAQNKLAQLDEQVRRAATINLGIPTVREVAGRTASVAATPTMSQQAADEPSTPI